MKPKIILIIIGLIIVAFNEANAQIDTAKLTPSHLAAAEQLINTTGSTSERFNLMRNQLIGSMGQTIHIPEKNQGKFRSDLTAFLDKYMSFDVFKHKFVQLYAQAFTEDELKQLIEFYNSPIGKKVISKLPELTQASMSLMQNALKDHYSEIETIVSESLKE